jgi:DNA polymerase III sliding clamp (beta) subunit (PCNA family)
MINITEDGFDAGNILFRFSDVVEQFPNYAPVIPTEISQVDRIGLDPSKFDQIRKVLGKMSDTGRFELQFHGADKAVIIVPIGVDRSQALGLIMPVILND